jgi:type III restriction enzyme
MYRDDDITETVSVIGTDAFMDFVETIRNEGVEIDRRKMGQGTEPKAPLVIEVDYENNKKDIKTLDIEIPVLSPRIYREYKNLSLLDVSTFTNRKYPVKQFSEEEQREIIFRNIATEVVDHITKLDISIAPNCQSVIGFFTQVIMKDLRLVSGYDILYGKVKEFIIDRLFEEKTDINSLNILRNLSEVDVSKTLVETFKKAINDLTILNKGEAEIRDSIKISKCRPFVAKEQGYLIPKKSLFNKIIGDSELELEFANFLESCDDIISYVKNYFAVNFKIDYQNHNGEISNYYPDFIVKRNESEIYIVETKGLEDLDVPLKIERLDQWCKDVNAKNTGVTYHWLFVKDDEFREKIPRNFQELIKKFHKSQ